jgi:serine/threonine protein kinase
MDPSLMAGKGYSLKSDVYSFGIILYEVCSLTIAYGKNKNCSSLKEFNRRLVEHDMTPKLNRISCPITRRLIEDCWQTDPNKRPSFEEIYQRIKEVIKIDRRQQQPEFRRGSM